MVVVTRRALVTKESDSELAVSQAQSYGPLEWDRDVN